MSSPLAANSICKLGRNNNLAVSLLGHYWNNVKLYDQLLIDSGI